MTRNELIADLRERADRWMNETMAGVYWHGYARGLRAAADAIELNLKDNEIENVP